MIVSPLMARASCSSGREELNLSHIGQLSSRNDILIWTIYKLTIPCPCLSKLIGFPPFWIQHHAHREFA